MARMMKLVLMGLVLGLTGVSRAEAGLLLPAVQKAREAASTSYPVLIDDAGVGAVPASSTLLMSVLVEPALGFSLLSLSSIFDSGPAADFDESTGVLSLEVAFPQGGVFSGGLLEAAVLSVDVEETTTLRAISAVLRTATGGETALTLGEPGRIVVPEPTGLVVLGGGLLCGLRRRPSV
ncbi:MAG: hypothetical protein RIG82_00210 [Phycisphaeraceae bacterium]